MELMPIGDLHELILKETKFAESRARSIFQQLILAIDYLHSRKVSHRDLKLENILIDEHDRIKVADFGLSSFMPDGFFLFTSCGSEHYASPEVLSSTAYCGSEVDVWSCGVILFSMIAGYLPFEDNNIVGLTRKIKNANFRPPSSFSGTLKDLVYRMLDPDPIARITTNQIKSHPWFTEKMQKCLKIKKSLKINKKVFEECLNYPEFANLDLPRNIFVDRILWKNPITTFTVTYEILCDKEARVNQYETDEKQACFPTLKNTKRTLSKFDNFVQSSQEEVFSEELSTQVDTNESELTNWEFGFTSGLSGEDLAKHLTQVFTDFEFIVEKMTNFCYLLTKNWEKYENSISCTKETKPGAQEVSFLLHIYKAENSLYVLDLQASKSESQLRFLDLCSDIYQAFGKFIG